MYVSNNPITKYILVFARDFIRTFKMIYTLSYRNGINTFSSVLIKTIHPTESAQWAFERTHQMTEKQDFIIYKDRTRGRHNPL